MGLKHEDWKIAASYFTLGAYLFSAFDLKSGYRHIEIFGGHQTYLGVSWKHISSNLTVLCVYDFTFRFVVRASHFH